MTMLRELPRWSLVGAVVVVAGCVPVFNDADAGVVLQTGAHSLVRTDPPPDDACPQGGRVYAVGQDMNGDGALQDEEVTSTSLVCDGQDATVQRARTVEIAAGDERCPAGGNVIELGDDDDASGLLDDEEVETSVVVCHGDAAVVGQTLASLSSCAEGFVPVIDGAGTWTCAAPQVYDGSDFALASQGCPGSLVAVGVDASGALVCEARDVLTELACIEGQIPKWNGTAWACDVDESADPGTDTLAALTCAGGQVPKWTGAVWACASDVDTDTLAGLSCVNGQVAKRQGSAWVCASDIDTLTGLTCASGQVAKWSGLAWTCQADVDTNTLGALTCASGQVAKWNGSAWACAADVDTNTDTLTTLACASGQVAKWNGSAWACAADVDTDTNTDTLAALTCASGQVAKWNGSAWACAADVDTDTNTDTLAALTCASGQVAKWNGSAWACAADVDTDTDTDTLGDLACASGEVAKYDGAQWVCAADDDTASALYFRTVHVPASGTPTENGTFLRDVLLALVAPSSTNRFTLVLEAGTYDLGATSLALRPFVDVTGAGSATSIVGTGDAGAQNTVVVGAEDVTLRSLRVVATGATVRALRGTAALPTLVDVELVANGTVDARALSLDTLTALTGARAWRNVSLTATGDGTTACRALFVSTSEVSPLVVVRGLRASVSSCDAGTAVSVPAAWRVRDVVLDVDAIASGSTQTGLALAGEASLVRVALSTAGASSSTLVGVRLVGTGVLRDARVTSSGATGAGSTVNGVVAGVAGAVRARDLDVDVADAPTARALLVESGATCTVEGGALSASASTTAYAVESAGTVRLRRATLTTTSAPAGAALFVSAGTGTCDQCVLTGFTVAVDADGDASLGGSQIDGTRTGSVTCVTSYDGDYNAILCL